MNIVSWHVRRRDAAAMIVIILFFLVLFSPSLFFNKFMIVADSYCYSYPLRMVAWDELRRGELPLWTPLILSGYPLLSMAQLGLGYPLTWGYLLLPGHWAEEIYVLAPYLLAPLFTYAYARQAGRSRAASLLAAFAFSYGGMMFSKFTSNGMMTNAVMWMPLMLIGIDRARTQSFAPCLLLAAGAYTMSVLTGIGQGFLFAGLLAVAYAVFICMVPKESSAEESSRRRTWSDWRRWKPLAVALGAIVMAVGVAAFQIFETLRAARRSVRSVLSYATFGEGSFTLEMAWKSFIAPFYNGNDVDITTYVAPLAVALAVFGVVTVVRDPRRDVRVFFWLGTAVVAWVLMLGVNTPLYRLIYYMPFLNRFRVPSRHAVEWTFALSILAAYGWDAFGRVVRGSSSVAARNQRREILTGVILLTLGAMVCALWWTAMGQTPTPDSPVYTGLAESSYIWWRTGFTLLMLMVVWQGWRVAAQGWRTGILLGAVVLSCFIEPFILASHWWHPWAKPASQFASASTATRFLQNYPPEQNRVYTRVNLFMEQASVLERIDTHNVTALHGLHNVAGYEPLIMERYSRALGNVGVDSVNPRPGFTPDRMLFEPRAHVLDILNTRFIAAFSNLTTTPNKLIEKEGISFAATEMDGELPPGQVKTLTGGRAEGDTLAFVTSLSHSGNEIENTPVAKLRVFTSEGLVVERELRAGVDTAEWAHERADVRASVRHSLAPVFDSNRGDSSNSFQSHRYWTRISLGERLQVNRIEVINLSPRASIAVWKASLYDSASNLSTPLGGSHTPAPLLLDSNRWQRAFNHDDMLILRNNRALPRAWLVAEAEAVDAEEALKRIRGEGAHVFDPRRTALLEVPPNELPALPGGAISPGGTARFIEYRANDSVIETEAETPSVLVMSEMYYPGWMARVDGEPTPIHATNFVLRGVVVPAGRHRVEMRYTAPAAQSGALISLVTLLVIGGIAVHARRTFSG